MGKSKNHHKKFRFLLNSRTKSCLNSGIGTIRFVVEYNAMNSQIQTNSTHAADYDRRRVLRGRCDSPYFVSFRTEEDLLDNPTQPARKFIFMDELIHLLFDSESFSTIYRYRYNRVFVCIWQSISPSNTTIAGSNLVVAVYNNNNNNSKKKMKFAAAATTTTLFWIHIISIISFCRRAIADDSVRVVKHIH